VADTALALAEEDLLPAQLGELSEHIELWRWREPQHRLELGHDVDLDDRARECLRPSSPPTRRAIGAQLKICSALVPNALASSLVARSAKDTVSRSGGKVKGRLERSAEHVVHVAPSIRRPSPAATSAPPTRTK